MTVLGILVGSISFGFAVWFDVGPLVAVSFAIIALVVILGLQGPPEEEPAAGVTVRHDPDPHRTPRTG